MNESFWRNKNVFVTGHTGFKGSWISLWLTELGANVTGYALDPPTSPSLFNSLGLGERLNSHIGDIRRLDELCRVMTNAQPEVVIHMAAQPLVLRSYEEPIETYMTNVMGTVHVFEAARKTDSVGAIVNVTTDKCYENKEWRWGYREDEPMGGYDPYSSSKGCSELLTTSYQKSFFNKAGVRLASARAGNVIGGGDWADNRLVPDLIRAIMAEELVVIRNPHSIRPWQHVLEPIAGYLSLAEKLSGSSGEKYVGGWNFGPSDGDAQTVAWIADRLCERWGEGAGWELDDPDKDSLHEATYLKLDCTKARAELGWRPRLSLENALDWIVAWYQGYQQQGDLLAITTRQIQQYGALMHTESIVR